ncbi:MAG: vitamin B12-dependent ribonucleotide reductase [Calditrichaeota bacterium]|nr:vitamin B12-dependent ribonucleotide reductase [Calditrichota bacterium]
MSAEITEIESSNLVTEAPPQDRESPDQAPAKEPLPTIALTENALTVLKRRYLLKDEQGNVIEAPEQLFRRVANFIASADLVYNPQADVRDTSEKFYRMMATLEFIPNSPTLMNAGRRLGQLSACFVLPVDDSMDSIFETVKNTALIHKSGGGTGFSFSRIRPNKDIVQSTKGVSSGPISFMTVFDAATEAIKQGGTRRGANMAVLRVDHPDILEFITAKAENDRLNNFNISVGLTEAFMAALKNDEEYQLINPRNDQPAGKLKAREVFDKIVEMAWKNGEPGIVFLDQINSDNPTPGIGEIESTNPCGEQPLLPYESCNLGSINLARFVSDGGIDFDRLRETVRLAIHFLDNVIDKNKFPLPEIAEMTRGNRKIGLGVMGFADLLLQLKIPYNSEEGIAIAEKVMSFISDEADQMSVELAQMRGVFPNFEKSIYRENGPRLRNATRTTIAPTGTISIIAGCSSGVEPLFALTFWRNVMDNDRLLEVHPLFEKIARENGFYSDEIMNRVAEEGSIQRIDEIPEAVRRIFVAAHDISPQWHIRMQAAFQKYTDNAVSKTVNFANHATVDDVKEVYELAYQLNCKGVTIYRDGSREQQVLNVGKIKKAAPDQPVQVQSRPEVLTGKTIRMRTGCGSMYVTINENEQGLFEVFSTIGKAGGCAASQAEAIGRLISLALRSGVEPLEVQKELIGINCHKPFGFGKNKVTSCADAIAKAIGFYLNNKNSAAEKIKSFGACPECGGQIEYESGCSVCRSCGYSECG